MAGPAPAALAHHRGGLDERRRLDSLGEPQFLDRVSGDRGGYPVRARLDLNQRHHAVDLDRGDDAAEAVPRRGRGSGLMPLRGGAQAFDLRHRDPTPVRPVTGGLELAVAVPAPQRVNAHSNLLRSLTEAQILRHCLSIA